MFFYQDVVKSLASDPAVWNAMLNNEKLLQFASSQPSTDGTFEKKILLYINLGLCECYVKSKEEHSRLFFYRASEG